MANGKIKPGEKERHIPFDISTVSTTSTQSYDLTNIVPYRSLLRTVIPGWLWSGITDNGGMQNIPICDIVREYTSYRSFSKEGLKCSINSVKAKQNIKYEFKAKQIYTPGTNI